MKKFIRTRRDFLKTMGLGAAAAAVPGCGETPSEKPNFIVILVDDMGWIDSGCYGSRYYETPNIDRLASQGMRFTDGYASCAVCSPTRASVMTGRYPARVGVTDWIRADFQKDNIPPVEPDIPEGYARINNRKLLCPRNPIWMELNEITIAEALKPAGYTSCHIGKWHLGPEDHYPEKQGFDYNIGGCDFGEPPTYFDPYYSDKRNIGSIPTLKPRKRGEYLTDREGDEAVRFISNHSNRPFFLYMAHYAVHTPIEGKKNLVEKYRAKKPTLQKNPEYAAMIESVDDAVGKIMAVLDELNLTNRTLVIFTSDNGGFLGSNKMEVTSNLPLRAGKGYPYEGGIREPLIVRWPGVIVAGSECSVPVTSVDYFPTICEAAGVDLPFDRTIDGESILPLLKQSGTMKRDAIFWHFPHYRGSIVPYSIIRAGNWKLIKNYEGKTYELFHLGDDLPEQNDLSEQMPEKVRVLDARLTAWLKNTGARILIPNPKYSQTNTEK